VVVEDPEGLGALFLVYPLDVPACCSLVVPALR
jgi:hypothetical protein